MAMTTLLPTPKSEAAWKAAGATMNAEMAEMKVNEETTKAVTHLRRNDQLHRDNEFGYYRLCAKLLRIMSHGLTFSGCRDLGDRPNR